MALLVPARVVLKMAVRATKLPRPLLALLFPRTRCLLLSPRLQCNSLRRQVTSRGMLLSVLLAIGTYMVTPPI